jgi:DNA adenine methylase
VPRRAQVRLLASEASQLEPSATSKSVKPFLKWAGGKQQLLGEIRRLVPPRFRNYREPFLGSGAVFFDLTPSGSFLSDANAELVTAFLGVRDHVEEVISELSRHENSLEHFQRIRALNPDSLSMTQRAARVLYLNRTCFNGLYRVNRRGQFNTPFGHYRNPRIVDGPLLRAASVVLQRATIKHEDFRTALTRAEKGDFVYLDPPYIPVGLYSDFRRYHSSPFTEEDHRELTELYADLDRRGCFVLLSNSYCDLSLNLYERWRVDVVKVRRRINSKSDGRGEVREILVRNYELA